MTSNRFSISGKVVDVVSREIINAEVYVEEGRITSISKRDSVPDQYILPGLVDAHMHIESTLLIPSRFASLVVQFGTLGLVTDPHEIANVLGEIGVDFMINDAGKVPLEIRFGVPSCVPATKHETSGFVLDSNIVESLLKREEVVCLAEVMDFVGVIEDDLEVLKKIVACKNLGKKIDGHAPGLKGKDLKKYVASGISADHECSTLEEALEKISLGMMIQIREGSAAKDFEALYSLLETHPDRIMLCTDDLHPDDLIENGHINFLIKRGLKKGLNLFSLLRAASYNPIHHYGLNLGLLQVGDSADFIVIDHPESFVVEQAFRKGVCIYKNKEVLFDVSNEIILNNFSRKPIQLADLTVKPQNGSLRAMVVKDGDLITDSILCAPKVIDSNVVSDVDNDLLKMVVMSRYDNGKPVMGFAKGFGFKNGAIAESIAHDSHNIIAVGTSDEDLLHAINTLIEMKGGIVAVNNGESESVELEVAGLMSNKKGEDLVREYAKLSEFASDLGSNFQSPFMTLAFMSLLVIPKLKLSDKGLFDVKEFRVIDLFKEE
ncbi:adenine deaminase [Labilibaculum euxinus]|uniref:Adenine deaminase n=1 Tax=Labilibaculum euxinus TaxID=2686357 RepID=A0A7M4D2M4_9BACT|nr:adenine deaminase [Labilibaculum euxinus]MUP36903.1 adenine deaminase [Labilibaculum euxinus]MVB06108.1 adenine deaminase [Labilibaculum euxinus]